MMTHRTRNLLLLFLFMLLGVALRFNGLGTMQSILHSDEAYYGLDALSLIENPRLQLYFPANTGREGLWMNLLAPFVGALGATPFALRVASAMVGIMTLAAVYWLGRETLGRGAIWCVAALAVLYWHVHLSHIGFRVITMMLLGALAFSALLRAHRTERGWWLVGLLLGLTLYTYIAARVYVAYTLLWMLWWAWREATQRRGIALSFAIVIVLSVPLAIALLIPSETTASLSRAAATDTTQIWQNTVNWGAAWLIRGDANPTHNLPNRPVLDIALAVLALAGVLGAWYTVRQRWMLLWWGGLVAVSLLPTILSINTPHFLRGAGLIVPLVLLIGAGGAIMDRWRYGWLLVTLLIAFSGWQSYTAFNTWLITETDRFGLGYDYRVSAAMQRIDAQTPPTQPIVMPTDDRYSPVADFLAAGIQRDIIFYPWSADECYLSPRTAHTALDLPIVLNSYAARVLPYIADLRTIYEDPDGDYNIFDVLPSVSLRDEWPTTATFGDALTAQVITPTATTITAGESLTVYWAMRITDRLPRTDYRVLLHLQGDPTPYDGGTLFATGDIPLCSLAYTPQAEDDVTLVQQLTLLIPPDLPAGDYHLAMGFYTPDDFTRLPVSPAENPHNYTRAWEIEIQPRD